MGQWSIDSRQYKSVALPIAMHKGKRRRASSPGPSKKLYLNLRIFQFLYGSRESVSIESRLLSPGHRCRKSELNTSWLSECCQAVNKLSREGLCFVQTHFLEPTNQNNNINTKFLKNKTDDSSFRVAVKRLSGVYRAKIIKVLKPKSSLDSGLDITVE